MTGVMVLAAWNCSRDWVSTTTISLFRLTIIRIQDCSIGSDLAKSRTLLLVLFSLPEGFHSLGSLLLCLRQPTALSALFLLS